MVRHSHKIMSAGETKVALALTVTIPSPMSPTTPMSPPASSPTEHPTSPDAVTSPIAKTKGTGTWLAGPMFAEKTTQLLRRIRINRERGTKCLALKFRGDTRYDVTNITSHNGDREEARGISSLDEITDTDLRGVGFVALDEAQCFPHVAKFCQRVADLGIDVTIAGLDTDYKQRPFDTMCGVKDVCNMELFTAKCVLCTGPAEYSRRICNETALIVIGGADKYVACCGACFDKPLSSV